MQKPALTVVAVILILLGGLWTLQGLDVVGGSAMSGVAFWAIAGPVVAGLGVALLLVVWGRRPR